MTEIATSPNAEEDLPLHSSIVRRLMQALVFGLILSSFLLFWCVGDLVRFPYQYKNSGSLLIQVSAGQTVVDLVGLGIVLSACAFLTDLLLRQRWSMAGLAIACCGLVAWSARGGPMREVLFYAQSKGIFIAMALEVLLLGAMVGGLWNFFWNRASPEPGRQLTPAALPKKTSGDNVEEGTSLAMALLAQVLTMAAVLLILLSYGDMKKQTVASVFIAGLAGTSVAESYFADASSARWYWLGPMVVASAGYIIAYATIPNWAGGNRLLDSISFAALARPLPLDYASSGMAGALFGYWLSQKSPDLAD